MNPIICKLPDDNEFNSRDELGYLGIENPDPFDSMRKLLDHAGDETHLSNALDWIFQLRDAEGLSYGEAIEAGMIAYFG